MPAYISASNKQRKLLRDWVRLRNPRPSLESAQRWLRETHKINASLTTVHNWLSDKFQHLDLGDKFDTDLNRSRRSTPKYPLLYQILFEFHEYMENVANEHTTIKMLLEAAEKIWKEICEPDWIQPKFDANWAKRFRKRYGIQSSKSHDNRNAAPPEAHVDMKIIRKIAAHYAWSDIYNMDECGLYWRRTPSSGYSSQALAGSNRDKNRITIALCVNADGTDKLPPLFIEPAVDPSDFLERDRIAHKFWLRGQESAWMTTALMKEWLQRFYRHVEGREVLLLMDNFIAHWRGLKEAPPPLNVNLVFLPGRSTSIYQPLDQGIIYNAKSHYLKQLVHTQIRNHYREMGHVKQGLEPQGVDKISKLQAITWFCDAWYDKVATTTVFNCYTKSTLFATENGSDSASQEVPAPRKFTPPRPDSDLTRLYTDLVNLTCTGEIRQSMDIRKFLNPDDENDSPLSVDQTIEFLIEEHTSPRTEKPTSIKDAIAPPKLNVPSYVVAEAVASLQDMLLPYECYTSVHEKCLNELFNALRLHANGEMAQTSISRLVEEEELDLC